MSEVEALEVAPDGTVVEDADGDWAVKRGGKWHGTEGWILPNKDFARHAPFRVVSRPVDEPTQ